MLIVGIQTVMSRKWHPLLGCSTLILRFGSNRRHYGPPAHVVLNLYYESVFFFISLRSHCFNPFSLPICSLVYNPHTASSCLVFFKITRCSFHFSPVFPICPMSSSNLYELQVTRVHRRATAYEVVVDQKTLSVTIVNGGLNREEVGSGTDETTMLTLKIKGVISVKGRNV